MKFSFLPLLLAASVAVAQPRPEGRMQRNTDGPGPMHDRIVRNLDLKDDQKKEFENLSSAMMKQQIDLRSKVAAARVDFRDLTRADKPDKAAITAKLDEITRLQGQMKTNHVQFWFDVNRLLTADQQKTWKKALEHPMEGRFAARGGHGGRGMMGHHRGFSDNENNSEETE
jgi:Spy/CpxP family protein refolding chaperone